MSGLAGLLVKGLTKQLAKKAEIPPPSASKKTQITTTTPTYKKAKNILDSDNKEGAILDYGAGKGVGAKAIKADTYEPFPDEDFLPDFINSSDIPSNSYSKITNLNVLNVVDKKTRDSIVKDISRILTPEGKAIISTRGKDVLEAKGTKGSEPMSIITSRGTYQKGFTQKELREYLESVLGKSFEVKNIKNLGKAAVEITKKSVSKKSGGMITRNPYGSNYQKAI